jgi:D-proline reductase (dithiol) PrdB
MFFDDMPEPSRSRLLDHPMPEMGETPCAGGPQLADRRIALITTAGLHSWRDAPFAPGRAEYRTIPAAMDMADVITSHPSTNIDRTGILRDIDTVFPIQRLPEMETEGAIGSVAAAHYSFLGSTPPETFEGLIGEIAAAMRADNVNGVLLAPV